MKKAFMAFAALIFALTGWLYVDEQTRLTLFHSNGFISSGTALGVTIGADQMATREQIRQKGMKFQRAQLGGTCFFQEVSKEYEVDVFFVESWHGGMVCLVSKDSQVRQLIWAFQPVSL